MTGPGTRVALALVLAVHATPSASASGDVDFERDVRPLLDARCFACHGPEKQKSSLRLDRRDSALRGGDSGTPAVVPGDSAASLLVRAVSGQDPDLSMPPKGEPLSGDEVLLLSSWIDEGARWGEAEEVERPPRWSLRPLTRPEPPDVRDATWALGPLDRFVLARLEAAGLAPSPDAGRAALIRRMSQLVLGLPPAPEEVEAFVHDPRPDAHERLVERLLASEHYGERWARHWLDLVRFAETDGFETNTPRANAWPYRDWVIAAFNDDLPFDRFVLEQLAGDVVGVDAATGFLVGGAYDNVKSPDVELTRQQRQDELADIVNATSTAFLGLTVACARCHDHKFDPITQTDYYAFQALFGGVRHGERPLRSTEDATRVGRLEEQRSRIARLRAELDALAAAAVVDTVEGDEESAGVALVIDDESLARVHSLRPEAGHGTNPAGTGRGERDDRGDTRRLPNLSRGRYTWWDGVVDEDVIAWEPGVRGRYRLWVSWGAGWDTHASDASYHLDRDGDLATTGDRSLVLAVDQRKFADGTREPPNRPLWSGLADVGVHALEPANRIVLRAGSEGRPVTADVIVLEQVSEVATASRLLPRLRSGVSAARTVESFEPVHARRLRFRVFATNSGSEPCLDELEVYAAAAAPSPGPSIADSSEQPVNLARGASIRTSGDYAGDPKHRPEHLNDGEYGNGRSWISDTSGTGWVEVELAAPAFVARVEWGRDREGVYADRLATEYVIEIEDERGQWVTVASSEGRLPPGTRARDVPAYRFAGSTDPTRARADALLAELRAHERALAELAQLPRVYGGVFEEPAPTHRLYRGEAMQERELVAPDVPRVLGSLGVERDAPEAERRLALARWLGDPANPLTARVAVNRIWMHHFGEGLVDTPSDFGAMGSEPSHPELLDWLASELVASGWSLKHVQRLILSSRTWRQSSRSEPRAVALDAESRLLWRFPPRRLEAESLRDAMLDVAGTLEHRGGGPGFSVFEPNDNYVRVYEPRATLGPDEWRRMVYMTKVRMERDAVFGVFDTPDAGQVCPERSRSTTALQALNLFNSAFALEQARRFAERLERETGADVSAAVRRAFALALGRAPDPDEAAAAEALARDHGLAALCRALFNANEFAFVH